MLMWTGRSRGVDRAAVVGARHDSVCRRERCRTRAGRGHADPSGKPIATSVTENRFNDELIAISLAAACRRPPHWTDGAVAAAHRR